MVDVYTNRTVTFRFDGAELRFHLSLALFSSHEVDAGSKLLLKTIVKQINLSAVDTLLDIGCGVGILGLSIAKRNPQMKVVLQDRDCLAVRFTEANAEINDIENYAVRADLAFLRLPENRFALIVANLPAKAGEPVLRHMVEGILGHLNTEEGPPSLAAVVVVEPLGRAVARMIGDAGGNIVYREETDKHTVYHFRRKGGSESTAAGISDFTHDAPYSLPKAYFRTEFNGEVHKIRYHLDTVWGLSGFDSPDFRAQLFSQWAAKHSRSGRLLVWNPGQGHIPAMALSSWTDSLESVDLAGRDKLSLAVSAHNLLFHVSGKTLPAADITELAGDNSYDTLVLNLEHLPGKIREQAVWDSLERLSAANGELVIIGKSSDLFPFSKGNRLFKLRYSQKHRGTRLLGFSRSG
jgi:SAM-dependent methyltransferase